MSELVRRDEPESAAIVERCCARVGFLGNPSDGFQGKTLSFLVNNFAATVTITPSTGSLTIIEEAIFEDILHVQRHSTLLVRTLATSMVHLYFNLSLFLVRAILVGCG